MTILDLGATCSIVLYGHTIGWILGGSGGATIKSCRNFCNVKIDGKTIKNTKPNNANVHYNLSQRFLKTKILAGKVLEGGGTSGPH